MTVYVDDSSVLLSVNDIIHSVCQCSVLLMMIVNDSQLCFLLMFNDITVQPNVNDDDDRCLLVLVIAMPQAVSMA